MPTYQYKCHDCGYLFEEFQSITDEPLTQCPECGGKVARLISGGAGFLFKGSGFYITDYRSDKYKKAAEMDKSSSREGQISPPVSGSSSTTKTDKKESTKDSVKKTA
jgi:putative FmdB family regulatory protein